MKRQDVIVVCRRSLLGSLELKLKAKRKYRHRLTVEEAPTVLILTMACH